MCLQEGEWCDANLRKTIADIQHKIDHVARHSHTGDVINLSVLSNILVKPNCEDQENEKQ